MAKVGRKRSKNQREKERAEIARLYLQGVYQVDIAEKLGLSQQQISYDLKVVRQKWQESAVVDFNEAKSRELAKIDNLELTYWESWQRSLQARKTETGKTTDGVSGQRTEASYREENQVGDPRFLQGIQWCIEKRCKIFGFDAAKKLENVQVDLHKLSNEQLERIANGEHPSTVMASSSQSRA